MNFVEDLAKNGYTIVKSVITKEEVAEAKALFAEWKATLGSEEDFAKMHRMTNPHGIFKFHEVGHQEFAWYLRCLPKIQKVFQTLWETEELVVSFDGACYMPSISQKKNVNWTHTDQAPKTKGITCYQSFISLTSNEEKTLVVYEGSHLLHDKYFKDKNDTSSKNWVLIDLDYLERIKETRRALKVEAGDLVIWDSRTFHQNQYGIASSNEEERLVQYLCYLPKNVKTNTAAQQAKRLKYFLERRTTSHWPYPIHVNGLQPQTYGQDERRIDYSALSPPNLSRFEEIIKTLI